MARSLKDVLKKHVLKEISRRAEAASSAGEIWRDVIPERFRDHARVVAYKRRLLDVIVDSPAVLAELEGFHRHQIKDEMKERFTKGGLVPPVRIRYTVEEHS